jgi:hypothetical protein
MSVKSAKKTRTTVGPSTPSTPFLIGAAYFIRTVTYHLTGRVKAIIGGFLVLEEAAWIADSGRFTQAIVNGKLNEVEPVTVPVFVNVNTITDAYEWRHSLPREQK